MLNLYCLNLYCLVCAMVRAFAMLFVLSGPAIAQPVLEPTKLPFSERFTEHVPVSGRTLVGVLFTAGVQPPEGAGLTTGSIALPVPLPSSTPVRVRETTQDGRYSAENNYQARDGGPASGRATLAWPTAYGQVLGGINLREVAAVPRSGSCAETSDVIPIIVGAAPGPGILQVLVNTRGSTVTAALRNIETGRTLRRANCVRVDGSSRVAFDARCVLGSVSDLPPLVSLRLEQVSRDGLQTEVLEAVPLRIAP